MDSQVGLAQSTDFGIYSGVNHSSITDLSGRERNTGLQVGIFTKMSLPTIPVDIQPELIYLRFNSNGGGPTMGERLPSHSFYSKRFDYFQLPILLKYDFLKMRPYTHNVFMGPYGSYNIDAETYFSPFTSYEGINISNYVNNLDYGMVIGTEAQFNFKMVVFSFGIRYQIGMRDVISEDVSAIVDEWGSFPTKEFLVEYFHGKKHRVISITSGFSF